MNELPNGFKSIENFGMFDFSKLGVGNWAKGENLIKPIDLMTIDTGSQLVVASCVVGILSKYANKEIKAHELPKYDELFYRLAHLVASKEYGRLCKLQVPRYETPSILYEATRRERVWAIHTSTKKVGLSGDYSMLALVARMPKSKESDVMSVLSSSTRRT